MKSITRWLAGLGILAAREDEDAARASGVDPVRHKLLALGLSSFFAGLAGSTFAYHEVSIYPNNPFNPVWGFDAIVITFVGGLGTLIGPVIGAAAFALIREQLALTLMPSDTRLLKEFLKEGSCDCSYSLADRARFRVNIFRQQGNFAIVMRNLQADMPSLQSRGLPPIFEQIAKVKHVLVLVTSSTGSG